MDKPHSLRLGFEDNYALHGFSEVEKIYDTHGIQKLIRSICSRMVVWNAFRLANIMLEEMDDVSIFLNGPSVEYEKFDSDQFSLKELVKIFTL